MIKKLIILITLLLLATSCDSGGGTDQEAAEENVEAGFAALEDALDECNDVSNCDFSEALEAFEEAVQNDPNNTDAQFGLAMIRMVSVINNEDMQALLESLDIGLDRVTGTSIPSTDNILSFIDQINFNQFNPVAFVSSSILDHDEDDMSIEEISEVVNLLHDVIDDVFIPTLSLSINGLNTLLNTNNFEFEITGDMQGDSNQSSMYIREAEIYALKAAMHALRAGLYIMSAYNLDPGTDEIAALNQNSSFLKIRSGNSNYLPNAHDDFNAIISSLQEIDDATKGDGFTGFTNSDEIEINNLASDLNNIVNSLYEAEICTDYETSTYTDCFEECDYDCWEECDTYWECTYVYDYYGGYDDCIEIENCWDECDYNCWDECDTYFYGQECVDTEDITIDISGFMNSPLNNLKDILPTYTVTNDCIVWAQNSASAWLNAFDFTFGGLFPFTTSDSDILGIDDDDLNDWENTICPED